MLLESVINIHFEYNQAALAVHQGLALGKAGSVCGSENG